MPITLNGEPREVADGHSVAALLADLGIPAERVAVELNLKVTDRQTFPGTPLSDGDRVEVIGVIGGGEGTRHERGSVSRPGYGVPCPAQGKIGEIERIRREPERHRVVGRGRWGGRRA